MPGGRAGGAGGTVGYTARRALGRLCCADPLQDRGPTAHPAPIPGVLEGLGLGGSLEAKAGASDLSFPETSEHRREGSLTLGGLVGTVGAVSPHSPVQARGSQKV